MSAWVSAAPAIGTGSLDGFAAAALMSVVCAMAVRTGAAGAGVAAAGAPARAVVGAAAGGRYGKAAAGHRSRHRRGDPNPGRALRDGVCPGIVFPDAEVALVAFASPRRPEGRRLPRHAAPSAGLGSRITAFGSRMTGLFATRALASGARG